MWKSIKEILVQIIKQDESKNKIKISDRLGRKKNFTDKKNVLRKSKKKGKYKEKIYMKRRKIRNSLRRKKIG